jgi:hypothetical protein
MMINVLGSIVNGYGDPYDRLMSTRIFILIMNKMFIFALQNYKTNGYEQNLDLLIILHSMCVSYLRRQPLYFMVVFFNHF